MLKGYAQVNVTDLSRRATPHLAQQLYGRGAGAGGGRRLDRVPGRRPAAVLGVNTSYRSSWARKKASRTGSTSCKTPCGSRYTWATTWAGRSRPRRRPSSRSAASGRAAAGRKGAAMELEHARRAVPGGWDEAVGASDDAWLFHTARWIEGTAQVWPLENHYFTVTRWRPDRGRVAGTTGARRAAAVGVAAGVLDEDGPGGFLCGARVGSGRPGPAVLALLDDGVIAWTKECAWGRSRLRRRRCAHGECAGPESARAARLAGPVDAHDDPPAGGLSTRIAPADTRRRIRRATEHGYTVRAEPWAEMLDAYYASHVENYGRTGRAPHPRAYFEMIAPRAAPARAGGAVGVPYGGGRAGGVPQLGAVRHGRRVLDELRPAGGRGGERELSALLARTRGCGQGGVPALRHRRGVSGAT